MRRKKINRQILIKMTMATMFFHIYCDTMAMGQNEEDKSGVILADFTELEALKTGPLILKDDLKSSYFLDDDEFNFTLKMRALEVLNYFSNLPFLKCDENNQGYHLCNRTTARRATERATARILLGRDIDLFKFLLNKDRFTKFGKYGSTTDFCSPRRRGDYDFATINYSMLLHTSLVMEGDDKTIFSEQQKKKLIFDILPTEGANFYKKFECNLKGPIGIKSFGDTENHILMVNASRYMNNNLILKCDKILGAQHCPAWFKEDRFNNESSGFTKKLADLLISYLKNHFEEYNSKPYQVYTTKALTLLATHAPDKVIRQLASMNLDYLSALMRFQGQDLRRIGTFRRQPTYKNAGSMIEGDPELERYVVLLGKFSGKQIELPHDATLFTASSAFLSSEGKNGYVVHPFLRRLWREERKSKWYGWHYHDNIEIFTLLEKTLLASGGMYKRYLPPALEWYGEIPVLGMLFKGIIHGHSQNKQDAWASPAVVLDLDYDSLEYKDYIHFKGHKNTFQRNNSCLYKNVICGMGLHIPPRFKFEKVKSSSNWEFYHNQESSSYIALWKQKCTKEACKNFPPQSDNYAILHIEDDNKIDFDEFKKNISSKEVKKTSEYIYEYTLSRKEKLEIEINQETGKTFVNKVNGKKYLHRSKKGSVIKGENISKSSTRLKIEDIDIEKGFPSKFRMNFESIEKIGIKTQN